MNKRTGMLALLLVAIMVFTAGSAAMAQEATVTPDATAAVEQPAAQPEAPAREQAPAADSLTSEATPTEEPAADAEPAAQATAEPAMEPAAETAESPAEQADAQPDEGTVAPDAAPEHPTPENVTVTMRCIAGDNLQYGDTVTVEATVRGLENIPYTLQWQYNDGTGWQNRDGATQRCYSFTLSRENAAYQWRVMITVA